MEKNIDRLRQAAKELGLDDFQKGQHPEFIRSLNEVASEEVKAALEMTPEKFVNMIRPSESKLAKETLEHNNTALGNIPQDLRTKINQEYHRLQKKHPDWKMNRLLRTAGKKHNVQFTFD